MVAELRKQSWTVGFAKVVFINLTEKPVKNASDQWKGLSFQSFEINFKIVLFRIRARDFTAENQTKYGLKYGRVLWQCEDFLFWELQGHIHDAVCLIVSLLCQRSWWCHALLLHTDHKEVINLEDYEQKEMRSEENLGILIAISYTSWALSTKVFLSPLSPVFIFIFWGAFKDIYKIAWTSYWVE